ncbi:hypothetical protein FRC01_005136, partial [Tulasnella sp. 417]
MRFTSALPQPLPQECAEASRIFKSFITPSDDYGLGNVVPRYVLQQAKGFVIISATNPGLVIARLPDGSTYRSEIKPPPRALSVDFTDKLRRQNNPACHASISKALSAPSAIGIAGTVLSTPRGAKLEESVIVLNSTPAVQWFMGAASFTLGGNLSFAVGPLGRDGEAGRTGVGAKEQVVDMYLYSGTKGWSAEGWTISARHNANTAAYKREVTSKQLLSGEISSPQWANGLNQTIMQAIGDGMPGWKELASRVPTTQNVASLVRHKNTTSLSPANNLNNDGLTGEYADPHSVRSSNPKYRGASGNKPQSRPGGTSAAAWARAGLSSGNTAAMVQQRNRPGFAGEDQPTVIDPVATFSDSYEEVSKQLVVGPPPPPRSYEVELAVDPPIEDELPPGSPSWRKAIALYDYSAKEGDQISFSKGEIFWVTNQWDESLWI